MLYVKAIDNQIVAYPYTQTDLSRDNPFTSFPPGFISTSDMAEWNVFPVHFSNQPVVDPLVQRVIELAPSFDGQSWIQQWGVEAIPQADIDDRNAQQAASIRTERKRLLTDSDWTQVEDAPVDKAAWAAYRQALRDIPDQPGFPFTIIWPEAPQ